MQQAGWCSMQLFTSLITVVAVCGVVRAVLSFVSPSGAIKKVTEISTNIIIMSVIVTEIINLIKNLFN